MAGSFEAELRDAIKSINGECKKTILQISSEESSSNKFAPDYLIKKDGKPFLIIEYKSKLTSLSESIFAKGLAEWGTYGILTDGKIFIVYGRKSYSEIKSDSDLKSAIKYLITVTEDIDNTNTSEYVNPIGDCIIGFATNRLKSNRIDRVIKLIEGWKESHVRFFEKENDSFVLTEDAEKALFRILLGHVKQDLCRYTTFRSMFRMLKNQKIYLNNIMNMNDKTEGSYYDGYVSNSESKPKALANKIEYFIMSCSNATKSDDFDMWRLYGDDTKGCCMLFSHNGSNSPDYKIFPVSYAQKDGKHPEVDFINDLVTKELADGMRIVIKNMSEWKLFFKPYEYHNEKEVRILRSYGQSIMDLEEEYFINEQYGIASKSLAIGFPNSPLRLEGIILGSGLPEKEANMAILEELLGKCITDRKIPIDYSKCKSYRA